MPGWRCFLIQPTRSYERSLRRYRVSNTGGPKCSTGHDYHGAMNPLDVVEAAEHPASVSGKLGAAGFPSTDPRWPVKCEACDYVLKDTDEWQLFVKQLYVMPDGKVANLFDVPPGAMWTADWYGDSGDGYKGPDGKVWVVKLPGHNSNDWTFYGPSRDGGHWTVTGAPPNVTCSPSIGTGAYHGFLRDGVLTQDVDGRTFPHQPYTA